MPVDESRYKWESRSLARARERAQFQALVARTSPLVQQGDTLSIQRAQRIAEQAAQAARARPLRLTPSPPQETAPPAVESRSPLSRLGDLFRDAVPQGVRDVAGGALKDTLGDVSSLEQFVGSRLELGTSGRIGQEDVSRGFDRLGVAGDVLDVAGAPTTLATAGVGGPVSAALKTGGPLARLGALMVEPVARGGFGTRLAAETAAGLGAMKASEEVAERVEGPLQTPLALLGGLVGGGLAAGGVQGVRAGARAAGVASPGEMLRTAREAGPLLAREAVPRAEIAPGFDSAVQKLRTLLNQEASLRRVGTPEREIRSGRRQQASGIERGLESLAPGATLDEAAAAALRGAHVGPLRQTFSPPLAFSPEENAAIVSHLAELARGGEISDFDFLNASVTMSRLVNEGGQRLQPAQRRLLSRIIGEDVVEALEARPPTVAAARKAEQREIVRERGRLERLAERTRQQAFEAEERANAAAVDVRLKQFSQKVEGTGPIQARAALRSAQEERLHALDAFNEADAAEIARLRALAPPEPELVQAAPTTPLERVPNAVLREPLAGTGPIESRARLSAAREPQETPFRAPPEPELGPASQPSAPTPRPVPLTNPRTGRPQAPAIEHALSRMPNDDMLLARTAELADGDPVLQEMVRVWLDTNRVVLDSVGSDPGLFASVRSAVAGELRDPWLTAAFHRRADLQSAMRVQGLDESLARKVADTLFERELQMRYGTERVFDDNGRLLQQFPEELRDLLEGTKRLPYAESTAGLDLFVQRFKNTIFGVFDVGVFGQQVLAAVKRGGVPLLTGYANRALTAMGHPLAPIAYADSFLPRQLRYALDGLPQHALTGAVRDPKQTGSLLQYLGPLGRKVDEPYMRLAEKSQEIQFGHVLTGVRNATYEGELAILHMLGRDISDPKVRRAAIRSANTVSSFAREALKPRRRSAESALQISATMMRSRFAHVEQMAKAVFSKNATPEERLLGSMMITSAVVHHFLLVKGLDALIGMGDAELDPTHPNAGRITTRLVGLDGRHLVLDLSPQDSVERAFTRSIRELAEGDDDAAEMAGKAWAQVFIGPASPVARVALAGTVDTGYQPGRGYAYGDLSTRAKLLNIAPLPPIFSNVLTEGVDPAEIVAETFGLTSFGESGLSEAERAAGRPFYDMRPSERQAFADTHPEIAKRMDEDTARRGGKPAGALQVRQETRGKQEALDAALLRGEVTRDDWRNSRSKFRDEQRARLKQIYGDRRITDPQNVTERYLQILQRHTNLTTDKPDWEAVDLDIAALPTEDRIELERTIGVGQTPLSREYAKLLAKYADLPLYRGYTADEGRHIDLLWAEVRNAGDSQLRQLRTLRRLGAGANPRVVKAVRRRIMDLGLTRDDKREKYKKSNPVLAALLGDGKLTERERGLLSKFGTT